MRLTQRIGRFFPLILLLGGSALAAAQAPVASSSTGAPLLPISVSFSVISLGGDVQGLVYKNNGKDQRIKIPSSYKPLPVRYHGLPKLLFSRPAANAKEQAILVAEAVLPQQATGNFLVLFSRDAKAPTERYMTYVVPDVDIKVGKNGWHFVNLSRQRTLVDMEKKRLVLEPGQATFVDFGAKEMQMMIRCFLQEGPAWSKTQSAGSSFYFRPGIPKTYFLLDNPTLPKSLIFHGVINAVEEKRAESGRRAP